MITLSGVTKRYGEKTAVEDLSFTVEQGQILGLLGQNGAGKTTTLNILTGYLAPTAGRVTVGGYDLLTAPRMAKKQIGYLPEVPPLYDEMTVRAALRFACELKLVVAADIPAHVEEIGRRTGLTDMLDRRIGNLSRGYRQRVGLAQALCGDPEALVLDEPTSGHVSGSEKKLLPALEKLPGVLRVNRLPDPAADTLSVELIHAPGERLQKRLFSLLASLNAPILRLQETEDSLEEVFLRVTREE